MAIDFTKMEAVGNDFVVVDNRSGLLSTLKPGIVKSICSRRTGVGADGLLLLSPHDEYDFLMEYYNADGSPGDMCGNGARCIALFAHELLRADEFRFLAGDGEHTAWVELKRVRVTIRVVGEPVEMTAAGRAGWLLDVGVPHFVTKGRADDSGEFVSRAATLRHHQVFGEAGTNVDFVEFGRNGELRVRTLERGVEGEMPSCGTGAVAAAWVAHKCQGYRLPVTVHTPGGKLVVRDGRNPEEVILEGPVREVYRGALNDEEWRASNWVKAD